MTSLPFRPRWLTWRTSLLCVPLLLLIWMGTSSYQSLRNQQQRVDGSDRVLALVSAVVQIHAALQEAESGQRAFLLTGKESYLTPYWYVSDKADEAFRAMVPIVKAIPDGPERLERLKTLSLAKLAGMKQTIDLYHPQGQEAANRKARRDALSENQRLNSELVGLNSILHEKIDQLSRSHADLAHMTWAVSHDKEPLRQISSYAQLLLRRRLATNADEAEFAGYISEGVKRANALLGGMLAYARSMRTQVDPSVQAEAEASVKRASPSRLPWILYLPSESGTAR